MSALTNKIFRNVVAAPALALAAATAAFVPAAGIAQTTPVAANTNAQTRAVAFQTLDGSSISVRGVQAGAAEASRDKIAIVIWGGNRELQQQAYNAALDLRDQGIPLAFIVGPSFDPANGQNYADIDIYALGAPITKDGDSLITIGSSRASELRPLLVAQATKASRQTFPPQVAALSMK